jgi:hypothetical protein
MEPISYITTGEKIYEFQGKMYTKEQYERILDLWGLRDASYIVSQMKKQLQGLDDSEPWIHDHMVLPIVEEMNCDIDNAFSDKYRYDFICEHWISIEDGRILEELAWHLQQLINRTIEKQLKKRLAKQTDKDGYITIYRGFNDRSREDGNSYTLSRNVAIWFSRRFAKEISYVNTYKIHIDNVLAFITERNEAEIIAMPEDVILLETNSYSDKVKISAGCKIEYINN